jgi:multiple sugar transport system permease protein
MMIPAQVSSLGFIRLAYQLGATDQLWMLIVPSIAAPSVYFYMLQYLKATLPLDLVEASRIDGSSEFMTFNRVVLPLMKPALAVQGIFSFVASWNNLYIPSLLLKSDDKKTLPVMLATLASQSFSKADAGQIWMVTFLAILPIVVVYLLLSKYIIKGVTSGSVKG